MRKIALFGPVLFLCLLTGCTKEIKTIDDSLTYTASAQPKAVYQMETVRSADLLALPSESLCVLPLDRQNDEVASITAKAGLLIDVTGGQVVFADSAYEKLYPASITKLMTALLVLQHCDLNETVTVSYNASHIGVYGAKLCGLAEGDRLSMETLLTSLLIYSGNDAGIAIAEHIAGSEEAFADMMNQEALRLGAVDTHFCNSHGLHDVNHYTTAYDIYLIMNELIQYPKFLSIVSMDSYTAQYQDKNGTVVEKVFESTNQFFTGAAVAPDGVTVLGGKTGTTNAAGSCLSLYVKSNTGNYYVAEIFKADSSTSLYNQMKALLDMIP